MKRNLTHLFGPLSMAVMLGCTVNSVDEEKAFEGAQAGKLASQEVLVGMERCAAHKVHEEKLKENPGLQQKMEAIEAHTQRFIETQGQKSGQNSGSTYSVDATSTATIEIPVVVNVLYNTSGQNISDDQIASQIKVLNLDFRAQNADLNTTSAFSAEKSDLNYHFTLVAINRKYTNKSSWGTRDAMKSSKKGGIDPTDPARNLNMWVCNIGGGILGYAQFPGGSLSTDGVVIGPEFFGNRTYMTTSSAYLAAPFDKGRTATHEVGHWMNLRHIWGDATCGTDYVNDTPSHNTANYGCPSAGHQSTCAGAPLEMTMNYMDYTDDACMYMFSAGQKVRTRAIFTSTGPRPGFYAARSL